MGAVERVEVGTASRRYGVVIGAGVLGALGAAVREAVASARLAHVFGDEGLPPETVRDVLASLAGAGLEAASSGVRPSEDGKSLQSAYAMLQAVAARGLERGDLVVALGGGITGDMAGFVAATYRRGVAWVNVPTTLLAMVDASVGGKTGVNLRVGGAAGLAGELQKNMVGAFWQPSLVVADVAVLGSLGERAFRAGLAECLKHAMLSAPFGDPELGAWTKGSLARVLERDAGTLVELVARNVRLKAAVVGGDEREESPDAAAGRALLNLGHTFGHAMETIPGVSPTPDRSTAPLQHGEAVALGLVCAARCAELMRLVGDGLADEVRRTLGHAGLPTVAHGLPGSDEVLERMRHDKKSAGGKLRLVLPCGPGVCRVVAAPGDEIVKAAVDAVRG
jgi:3-dehydroquinate synthetase